MAADSASGLAFASAAVSIYWTLGGTLLLDTVGGAIEELARERSLPAILVGATATLLKRLDATDASITALRPADPA